MHKAYTYHTNNCARFNAFGQGSRPIAGHTGQKQAIGYIGHKSEALVTDMP